MIQWRNKYLYNVFIPSQFSWTGTSVPGAWCESYALNHWEYSMAEWLYIISQIDSTVYNTHKF